MTSIRASGVGSGVWSVEGTASRSAAVGRQVASIEAVEDALVEVHDLEWRQPGGGRWPYAGDGPWHLVQGEAGDYAGDGVDGVSRSARPRSALDAADVGRYEATVAWLRFVPDAFDRRLLWLATERVYRGQGRDWRGIGRRLGCSLTTQRLFQRYRMGLALVVCGLNGWPSRRAKALLGRDGLVDAPVARPAMLVLPEEER
ncbi:hypothetical protein ACWPMX_07855 [Tsuneonella sp. HG094]